MTSSTRCMTQSLEDSIECSSTSVTRLPKASHKHLTHDFCSTGNRWTRAYGIKTKELVHKVLGCDKNAKKSGAWRRRFKTVAGQNLENRLIFCRSVSLRKPCCAAVKTFGTKGRSIFTRWQCYIVGPTGLKMLVLTSGT